MSRSALDQSLGQRLAAARQRCGMTQADLAEKLGVSKAAVAHLEHGRVKLSVERLVQIAKVLRCRPAALLRLSCALAPSDLLPLLLQLAQPHVFALDLHDFEKLDVRLLVSP